MRERIVRGHSDRVVAEVPMYDSNSRVPHDRARAPPDVDQVPIQQVNEQSRQHHAVRDNHD